MDKPGQDSNAPGPGPGLDKNFLPRDQAGTKSWKSPGSRAGSRAGISTPCRDPDTNLSPAQTSETYYLVVTSYFPQHLEKSQGDNSHDFLNYALNLLSEVYIVF